MPVALGWLREVRRVLAPGGLLRLTTPDLKTYVDGYAGTEFYTEHRSRPDVAGLDVAFRDDETIYVEVRR